jgi:hypothetical protein
MKVPNWAILVASDDHKLTPGRGKPDLNAAVRSGHSHQFSVLTECHSLNCLRLVMGEPVADHFCLDCHGLLFRRVCTLLLLWGLALSFHFTYFNLIKIVIKF